MITDHSYRPPADNGRTRARAPMLQRPCEYMNCRRPRADHQRAVTGRTWS